MTYTVVAIAKDDAGAVTIEGSGGSGQLTRPAAAVGMTVAVSSSGSLISVKVTGVSNASITFTVSHPDHPDLTVELQAGQSQDVFPGDGSAGVRVSVTSP